MNNYFELLTELLRAKGAYFILILLFLENVPFVGFAAPAITTLIIVGFTFSQSPIELLGFTLVAYAGVVLADNLWFQIGRWSGGRWRWLKSVDSRGAAALETLKRQPRWVFWFYQFPPYFRMFLPFALGAARFALGRWLAINSVGSILYVLVWIGIGAFSGWMLLTESDAHSIGKAVTVAITLGSLIYLVFLFRRYLERRREQR